MVFRLSIWRGFGALFGGKSATHPPGGNEFCHDYVQLYKYLFAMKLNKQSQIYWPTWYEVSEASGLHKVWIDTRHPKKNRLLILCI